MSWGAGCSCFEGREDTPMSDEPTKLNYMNFPSGLDVTDAELIPKLHGGLREINLA